MRHEEIIISGFGGQGALFAGQVLAYAAMDNQYEVSWIPSYGPEMRGGKVRCTTIISDEEIGSPVVRRPSCAIVMNGSSMDAFEPFVKANGLLVVNSSLIAKRSERTDITTFHLPASDIATKMGNVRLANMVCLGCLIEARGIVSLDQVMKTLKVHLPKRHTNLLGLNYEALAKGAELVTAA